MDRLVRRVRSSRRNLRSSRVADINRNWAPRHADVRRPEDRAPCEEILADQRLDRRGVLAGPPGRRTAPVATSGFPDPVGVTRTTSPPPRSSISASSCAGYRGVPHAIPPDQLAAMTLTGRGCSMSWERQSALRKRTTEVAAHQFDRILCRAASGPSSPNPCWHCCCLRGDLLRLAISPYAHAANRTHVGDVTAVAGATMTGRFPAAVPVRSPCSPRRPKPCAAHCANC